VHLLANSDPMNPTRSVALRRRRGAVNTVVVLLVGILTALVVLILTLVFLSRDQGLKSSGGSPGSSEKVAVSAGQTIRRSELPRPPVSPKRVGDPDRIRETLRVGKTYEIVIKAGLDARVEDKAWGFKQVTNLAYAAEMAIERVVESNDGRRVVELRRFVKSRNVKLLCDVEGVVIELGTPGMLLLGALDAVLPGTTAAFTFATPIVETPLGYGARGAAQAKAAKAVAHVDTLSGKAVRIAYVDGVGVESIEPVGCTLSDSERDFVFGTAVMSDCYILPDVKIAPGRDWTVEGSQLAGLLDPSLRGWTSGEVVVDRHGDSHEGGKDYAMLQIRSGSLSVDSSDARTRRIGSFSPRGTMRFCLADGFVDRRASAHSREPW
jgi:hypothetical protein